MKLVVPKITGQSWDTVRAISFSRDVLEPKGKGKVWFSKLYIITENPEKPFSKPNFYDTLKRGNK